MVMKKPGDLSSELAGGPGLAHRNGMLEELPLDLSREVVPLHDHRSPEALQNPLFHLPEARLLVGTHLDSSAFIVPPGEGSGQLITRFLLLAFLCRHESSDCPSRRGKQGTCGRLPRRAQHDGGSEEAHWAQSHAPGCLPAGGL